MMTRISDQALHSLLSDNGSGDLRMAAIDVGSNSLHMVIAQVDPDGGATTLWRMKEMVGLGRNSFPAHRLSQHSMDRAIATLQRFHGMALRRGCEKVVAVATSAVREAENGGDFILRAQREVGLDIRVVSAREEARLIHLGVRHSMDFAGGPHLIMDVGGGSVELIVADQRHTLLMESRKLGAARMSARFIKSDPPKGKEIDALMEHYEVELQEILEDAGKLSLVGAVGSSGTMENLALLCRSGRRAQEGETLELLRSELDELVEKLLKSDAAQRVEMRGMDEKRQDQITAGALLVQFVMQRLNLKRFVLCRSALREGIVLEYAGRHLPDLAIRRKVPDPRRRSVLDLARRCEWNEQHSTHVAKITLRLFDELKQIHCLDGKARELIEYGAMLHDIGRHISPESHHKHSMYLVQHGELKGFDKEEVAVIANVARYHRKSGPKDTHEAYGSLSRDLRRIVDVGASLLRIADGLDRSHCRVVGDLRTKVGKRRVKVLLKGRSDMELEIWAARRKTDLFAKVFGRTVSVRSKA